MIVPGSAVCSTAAARTAVSPITTGGVPEGVPDATDEHWTSVQPQTYVQTCCWRSPKHSLGVVQRLVEIKGRQDGPLRVVCLGQCRAKHGHETPARDVQKRPPMAVHLSVGVLIHHAHHV